MLVSLIHFKRSSEVHPHADLGEKIARACLGFLRLSCGKTIEVTADQGSVSGLSFHVRKRPFLKRISAVVIAILLLPVTLLLTGVGCVGMACSKSQFTLNEKYFEQRQAEKVRSSEPPPQPTNSPPPSTPRNEDEDKDVNNKDDNIEEEPTSPQKEPTPFTRKFQRAEGLNELWRKPCVSAAIQELEKDLFVKQIIDAWARAMQQEPKTKGMSLLDAMDSNIVRGTCFGQAMNILELLGSKKREEVTEEYIAKSMTWQHYVFYQIVHTLHVFVQNLNSSIAYGLDVNKARKKLESLLPCSDKKTHSSAKMKLADYDKNHLAGELSDFIKVHIRSANSGGEKKDYAVKVSLMGNEGGHAAILYYSETEGQYFWYDPYSPEDGLSSSNHTSTFFRGVAGLLLKYKASEFTDIKFTAYNL